MIQTAILRRSVAVAGCCLSGSGALGAQLPVGVDSARVVDVGRFQDAIATALVANDGTFLDSAYAKEYTFINALGMVRAKPEVLRAQAAGELRTTALAYRSVQVRVYGELAIATGIAQVTAVDRGTAFSGHSRFTRVQVFRDDRWQVVRYQLTRLASP